MDPVVVIIVMAVGVLAALVLGWWLGQRGTAPVIAELEQAREERETLRNNVDHFRDQFMKAGVDLAASAEKAARVAGLEDALAALRIAANDARSEADRLRPVADRVTAQDEDLATLRVEKELLATQAETAKRLPALEAALAEQRCLADDARSEADSLRPVAERVVAQDGELVALRKEKEALASAKAAYERGEAERLEAYGKQLATLKELEAKLESSFGQLATKAVDGAHDRFLKQAEERFGHAGKQNEAKLKELLQPVHTTLERYEAGLREVEKARTDSYGSLKEAVAQLSLGNETVRRETQRLANVMRSSPKARGRWGEEQLRNILEAAGLSENVDFTLQTTISDGERQLRPDCIITLPGNRCIVIDVKCPLVHFEAAFDEEDEAIRTDLLLRHADAIRAYAGNLGGKAYQRQFEISPDFVIMFIPGEHFLSAAAERAPDLIEAAFRNGVIIASTINMLALAKIMAGMWRQESLAAQAKEVAEVGKELYKRLSVMGAHVAKLGRNLGLATGAYNDFVGSLESQVLTQAKRFEALKVDTGGKAIETLTMIDTGPRMLTKLDAAGAPEVAETAEAAE